MAFIDHFITFAVWLIIGCSALAKVLWPYLQANPIYEGDAEEAKRDRINREYKTNRGSAIIGLFAIALWALVATVVVDEYGISAFAVVVSVLLVLPVAGVGLIAVVIYNFAVHGIAHLRER